MMRLQKSDSEPVQAATISRWEGQSLETVHFADPLDADQASDPVVKLSNRQLGRLMFIAAETGARFEREGVTVDPVAWLFAPRDLFHRRHAVDACQEREPFVRAILLHGLSMGFDADPDEIDVLVDIDDGSAIVELSGDKYPSNAVPAFDELSTA